MITVLCYFVDKVTRKSHWVCIVLFSSDGQPSPRLQASLAGCVHTHSSGWEHLLWRQHRTSYIHSPRTQNGPPGPQGRTTTLFIGLQGDRLSWGPASVASWQTLPGGRDDTLASGLLGLSLVFLALDCWGCRKENGSA